jgi:hypothetical protein
MWRPGLSFDLAGTRVFVSHKQLFQSTALCERVLEPTLNSSALPRQNEFGRGFFLSTLEIYDKFKIEDSKETDDDSTLIINL